MSRLTVSCRTAQADHAVDLSAFAPAFKRAAESSAIPITLILHVSTGQVVAAELGKGKGSGDSVELLPLNERDKEDSVDEHSTLPGRPDLPHHVGQFVHQHGTAAVAVCGPKEMVFDVRNAVADAQLRIAAGTTRCVECFLHAEVFEW